MKKVIFLILGFICTILGIIGAILPVMPGLIFFVMAGYFFSKSSKKMHERLLSLPYVGQAMKDWDNYGVMTIQTKLGLIIFCFMTTFMTGYFYQQNLAIGIILFTLSVIAFFTIFAIDKKE